VDHVYLNFRLVEVRSLQLGAASLVRDIAVLVYIVQTCPLSEKHKPATYKYSNLSYIIPLMDLLFQLGHFTSYFEDGKVCVFHRDPLGLSAS